MPRIAIFLDFSRISACSEIDLLEVSLHATVATTAKYVAKKLERVQLSEEQRRIFYEEEGGTSNALKAVFGYEPQDSKRLCPHFDAVTGRCFKGNSCRLEHIAPLEGIYLTNKRPFSPPFWLNAADICMINGQ